MSCSAFEPLKSSLTVQPSMTASPTCSYSHAADYPVILSIEMHCCPEQQDTIVKYMEAGFGDILLRPGSGGPFDWSQKKLSQVRQSVRTLVRALRYKCSCDVD